jgi:hypothetical protein
MTTRGPRAPGSTPSTSSRRASHGAGARPTTGATSASDNNLTYLRIVEQVTGSGITQEELGSAVGASLRSVQNWASGTAAPRGTSRERLLDVKYIVEELRAAYTDEGIEIWLHARNRNLGGQRPIDLLAEGDVDTVVEEAQRVSGAM